MTNAWRKTKPEVKCSEKRWCLPMRMSLNDEANARKKGIATVVLTSVLGMGSRLIGVAYKKTAKDLGVMLNFCPWCGEPILWEHAKPKKGT